MRRLPLLLLPALWACAGTPPRPVAVPVTPEEEESAPPVVAHAELGNGLTLHVERAPAEAVAVQLWLAAGSAYEDAAAPGAAAALQRLVLELPAGDGLRDRLERAGGRVEGWTAPDVAVIELVVTPEQLEPALQALAEAVQAGGGELDAGRVGAVAAELDAAAGRARREPVRRALEALMAASFEAHPYARPPLAPAGALAALSGDALRTFHGRRYRPDAAHLAVVGDLDPAEVRAQVGRAFGGWRGKAASSASAARVPAGPLVRLVRDPGASARLAVAFVVAPGEAAEAGRLDLLAALLDGAEGRVARDARRAGLEDVSARAWPLLLDGAARFVVELALPPGRVDEGWAVLAESLLTFADRPPTAAEVERARRRLRHARAYARATPQSRAHQIGARALRGPAGEAGQRAIDGAGPEALAALAARVFDLKGLHAVAVVPHDAPAPDDGLWAEALLERARGAVSPPPGDDAGRAELAPGLTLVVDPQPGRPLVTLHAAVRGGLAATPPDQPGLAHLVARRLAAAAPEGLRIATAVQADHLAITLTAPASELDAALAELARRVTDPGWSGDAVERARHEATADLVAAAADPARAARTLFRDALDGRDVGPDTRATTLRAATPAIAARWFDAHVAHAPMVLAVSGDVAPAHVHRVLRRLLGAARPLVPVRRRAAPVEQTSTVRRSVDSTLGTLLIGHAVPLADPDDAAAVEVAAELLAGRGSRLQGLLVGARGDVRLEPVVELRSGIAHLGVLVQAPPALLPEARRRVQSELDRLRQVEPGEEEEVEPARRRLVAARAIALQSGVARAAWLARTALDGRPYTGPDGLRAWRAAVGRVTPRALRGLADRAFDPARRVEVELAPEKAAERPVSLR